MKPGDWVETLWDNGTITPAGVAKGSSTIVHSTEIMATGLPGTTPRRFTITWMVVVRARLSRVTIRPPIVRVAHMM